MLGINRSCNGLADTGWMRGGYLICMTNKFAMGIAQVGDGREQGLLCGGDDGAFMLGFGSEERRGVS